MRDAEKAASLARLLEGLELDSADGRAGVMAILREIEAAAPGSVERMSASLQLRRLGLRTSVAH
ncbi:hypothetical protein [Brevundimonas sp. LjRoot202]|uniref:hypothetical protein n=1 Tax=Brevundimonas sp. LjRoot202 TaxID=3342281 RepID=UPI003ECD8FEA